MFATQDTAVANLQGLCSGSFFSKCEIKSDFRATRFKTLKQAVDQFLIGLRQLLAGKRG